MHIERLTELLARYDEAPEEFKATSYWEPYHRQLIELIPQLDPGELRSGAHPILGTFGFGDVVYPPGAQSSRVKGWVRRLVQEAVIADRAILPYQLRTSDIRELAFRHARLAGVAAAARPIDSIEVSDFGGPQDLFDIGGRRYTMAFLSSYVRYCFAHSVIGLRGDEVVAELGPGSGYQIEVLKKLYPDMTILCFDLPGQIFLCQEYLEHALGADRVVGTQETLNWTDLSKVTPGAVHCFGNWQTPLLAGTPHDVFWNAASFGEMEPDVVESYLQHVRGTAAWIYLLQARLGKEAEGSVRVRTPITFADYEAMIPEYERRAERDAWQAHRRLAASGGYFEAVWGLSR